MQQQLIRHMEWADAQVWRAVLALPLSQADPRLRELTYHVHTVHWAYLQIWCGESLDVPEPDTFENLEAVRDWGRRYYTELAAHPELLDASAMQDEVQFPWAEQVKERFGSAEPATRLDSLFQVASHTTYHRGQVNARLREIGGDPPLVDYIAWVWQGRPEPEWDDASSRSA